MAAKNGWCEPPKRMTPSKIAARELSQQSD
jgi:hypothetical protein